MKRQIDLSMMAKILRERPSDAHKGVMGHALLAVGSFGMAGCAFLAAEACMRSGVGKLTIHTPECNRVILQTSLPEAILHLQENEAYLHQAPEDLSPYRAIGIGPGIGRQSLQVIQEYIENSIIPIVIDADALHILAEEPSLMRTLGGRSVLTPHLGEMQHLAQAFSLTGNTWEEKASSLASEYGLIVILKGHPSQICLPDGSTQACPRGNAGMATAGSGDVLTGITTGLLAQGYSITEAALLGVWLHATAGDFAKEELGEEALLARNIIRHLPEAFRELHSNKQILQ